MRNSITNMISAFISSIRYMVRRVIITYQFYHPEIRMGGCVVRYARQNYPELIVAPMTPENIYNVARSMLTSVTGYFTEMVTDNRVEVQAERQRIGSKIADITTSELDGFKTPAPAETAASEQQYFGHPLQHGLVTSPVFVTPAPHQEQYQQRRADRLIQPQEQQVHSPQLLHKQLLHTEPKYLQTQQQQQQPSRVSSFNPISSMSTLPQQFPQRYRNIRRSAAGNILAYDDNDYIDTHSQSRSFEISPSRSIHIPLTFNEHRFLPAVISIRRRSVGGTSTTPTSSDNINYDGPWTAGDNQSSASDIGTANNNATAVTENANFPASKIFFENNLNVKQSNKKENEELSGAYVGPRQFTVADTMLPLPLPPSSTAPPQYVRLDEGQNRLPSPPQSQLQPPTTADLNFKVGHNDDDNDISNVDINGEEGVVMSAEDDNAKNGNTIDGENSTSSSDNAAGGGGIGGALANLFDFENIILESLGLTPKEVKTSSLTRCTQSYIMHILWRSLETLLTPR